MEFSTFQFAQTCPFLCCMLYHVTDIVQVWDFFADIQILHKAVFHQVFNRAQTPGYQKTSSARHYAAFYSLITNQYFLQ